MCVYVCLISSDRVRLEIFVRVGLCASAAGAWHMSAPLASQGLRRGEQDALSRLQRVALDQRQRESALSAEHHLALGHRRRLFSALPHRLRPPSEVLRGRVAHWHALPSSLICASYASRSRLSPDRAHVAARAHLRLVGRDIRRAQARLCRLSPVRLSSHATRHRQLLLADDSGRARKATGGARRSRTALACLQEASFRCVRVRIARLALLLRATQSLL